MRDLRDATTDYADGYRAGLAAAAAECRRIEAALLAAPAAPVDAAAHYHNAARAIDGLKPRREPTGMEYRGG